LCYDFTVTAKLAKLQKEKLADLSIGLGHIFFGSTVLPYFFPAIDRPDMIVLLFGLGFTIVLWILAIWIVGR